MHVDSGSVLDGIQGVEDAEACSVDTPLVERHATHQSSDEARLEPGESVGVESAMRFPALERLIVVIRAEVGVNEFECDARGGSVSKWQQEGNSKE
jgi:hypothetical protein